MTIKNQLHMMLKGIIILNDCAHVKWVPCHHGTVCPQVVDGGDSLQTWIVTVNTMNKQLQTVNKRWSSSFRLDRGLTTPHDKKPASYTKLWLQSLNERPFGRLTHRWQDNIKMDLWEIGLECGLDSFLLIIETSIRSLWTQ
jgi:hypothetical protein